MAVPLHRRRIAALRTRLGQLLLERGSVAVRTDSLGVPVDEWQAAALAAGEEVQRPVRTGLAQDGHVLWAVVTDWPRSFDELRRAAELAAAQRASVAAGPGTAPGRDARSSVG